MKQLVFKVLCGLIGIAGGVNAQVTMGSLNVSGQETKKTPIDKVQLVAQYEMAYVQDVTKPENVTEETMMLKIGGKSSLFYSYTRFVSDSVIRMQMAQSGGVVRREMRMGDGASNPGQITYQIYKNHPSGKTTTLDRIGPSGFRCEEANERPEWQVSQDTMTLLNHLCYRAACRFKGREYTVWFAPAIPRGDGPWKLCGLPGLILYAEDSQKHFVFECTGLLNARPDETIEYGADNYEPVSRQDLNRNYNRFAADPVGYITSSNPNIRIQLRNPDGSSDNPKNIPYNPIELSEK